ncbi:MAG: hypothetical protein LBV03_07140 [Fusobacteriales bacterium]|jgi:hypothetical protein|nr:hypothetical protein [Fusobacteriales bacterium]
MKKILLLLILLCTISFSNTIGGFGELKWGASREEVTKYLMKTYDLEEYSIYQIRNYTEVTYQSIYFGDVNLREINFYYNKNGQFYKWGAKSYTMRYDKTYLINRYKKAYNLKEKKDSNDVISLTGYPETEGFLIEIYPDRIEYDIEDFNYTFPK